MYLTLTAREAELLEAIDDLRYSANRRRDLHDDPVGAFELDEQADQKVDELLELNPSLSDLVHRKLA